MEDAQLPADVPSLVAAQVAAAEERAGSPHGDVINSFFELQAGRGFFNDFAAGSTLLLLCATCARWQYHPPLCKLTPPWLLLAGPHSTCPQVQL